MNIWFQLLEWMMNYLLQGRLLESSLGRIYLDEHFRSSDEFGFDSSNQVQKDEVDLSEVDAVAF